MKEIFKDIKGYEGIYQVSNLGRVKSLKRQRVHVDRIMKTPIDINGYCMTGLSKNGNTKTIAVHKLVAMNFLDYTPTTKSIVIDHINNIKSDNRLENIQIISNRKNTSKDIKGYTSEYVGVSWSKSNKGWFSTIHIDGNNVYLGTFKNELDAHYAYQEKLTEVI